MTKNIIYSYEYVKQELISEVGIPSSEIFEFQDSPIKNLYEGYFQFCQENLSEKCHLHKIQRAKFYYSNNYSVNAWACSHNGYFLIKVHMGTIFKLNEVFTAKNSLEENDSLKKYKVFTERLGIKLDFLMFQAATLFTFYHELAHLIQKSPLLENGIDESYSLSDQPIHLPDSHILEYDADLHAANYVCAHLIDAWKNQKKEFKTTESFQNIVTLGSASIFTYFLLLKADDNIYYNANSHPHSIVRISYIVDCFINVVKLNLPVDISVNQKLVITETFKISNDIISRIDSNRNFDRFAEIFLKENDNIENYIKSLIDVSSKAHFLVKNRINN